MYLTYLIYNFFPPKIAALEWDDKKMVRSVNCELNSGLDSFENTKAVFFCFKFPLNSVTFTFYQRNLPQKS